MSVEIGQKISHYEILEKIGEGGMGVVYKARDTSLNRFVALKFLPPHLTQLEENRERFIIEAQAASALDHNNICNIHEINESEDGQRFICMAYYEGESLRQKIKYGPIESDEAVAIVEQIARGLEAAHEQKIIHRDIKPGNIIITTRGNVKILDFGLAKLAGTELSRTTTSKGTAAYMCPEQIRGEKFDHRCDIWALGVLFYEMLTAHLPFDGDFPEPIMYAIVNENPKPLSNQLKNVPPFLQTILDILLEKDVERRYQNMSTLLQDLQSLKTNAHNPGILSKRTAKKIFTKKSFNLYAAIFISVTILFLFFYRTFIINEAGNGKLILVIPVENVFIGGDKPDFSDGITAMLINDLTQVSLLDVIHRNTAMQYKGTSKTPLEIHEELGIDYVVEPLIIQSGDQVKISATVFHSTGNIKKYLSYLAIWPDRLSIK
jgi:serine/threonine protein kinase